MVAKGLDYLEKNVKDDGGIYNKMLANYTTSVGLMAFQEANKDGKYDTIIKNATKFLKGLQDGDGRPQRPELRRCRLRSKGFPPDLSNTQFFIDALIPAGVPKDDPAIQRALKFVSRCQNLPGESNDQPFAQGDRGRQGRLHLHAVTPTTRQHQTPAGGLRSLGAMTYGGLKSFLYAGVSKDDPRVQGAINWIRAHYTLDENPGMEQAGLYYYYHTFGKAMEALGEDQFEDAKGVKHDWRQGTVRRPEVAAAGERQLHQQRRPGLRRGRPQPGDGLRPADAELHARGTVGRRSRPRRGGGRRARLACNHQP